MKHPDPQYRIVRYSSEWRNKWDIFVQQSRSPFVIFNRVFIEYHADRFCDHSLILVDENHKIAAIYPLNLTVDRTIHGHQGLTYGGIILPLRASPSLVEQSIQRLIEYCVGLRVNSIVLKPVPSQLTSSSNDDILYFLHRYGFVQLYTELSSYISQSTKLKISDSRRSSARRAERNQATYTDKLCLPTLHSLVTNALLRHDTTPTHSLEELVYLQENNRNDIFMRSVCIANRTESVALIFDYGRFWHTQYLAVSSEGGNMGALDYLLLKLIAESRLSLKGLSFGISTTQKGSYLNEGLYFYKQSFSSYPLTNQTLTLALN